MLNQEQKLASNTLEGPLLVLAGAGAGKTKTIVERIANLVISGVEPKNILAITFTNKAAKEMRERVIGRLNNHPTKFSFDSDPFVSTFHALGVHIIREWSHRLDLPRHFAIYDRNESRQAIRESLKESGLDPKQFDPGRILSIISKHKGDMLTVEEFSEQNNGNYMNEITAEVWRRYDNKLKRGRALDFDDLLLKTAVLLKNKAILSHYQDIWKYIHVDEYQDTNKVQYEITYLLASKYKNICVVGDIDQNIYTWRGAKLRNIIDFEKDYPKAKIIILEENYRSTKNILNAANKIIEKNEFRRDKKLVTKNDAGEPLGLNIALDEADEAYSVALKCKELIANGASPTEIAVLYRANFQSRIMEEAFLNEDIPYQVLGTRFFERQEIKDVLAYIGASLDPENNTFVKRIINKPARGIGKVSFLKIVSGNEALLSSKTKEEYLHFKNLLASIREKIETFGASDVVKYVVEKTGLEEVYKNDAGEESVLNMMELVTMAKKYDGIETVSAIEKLLSDSSLGSDQDEMDRIKKDGVRLMTVHASKGLEFDYVFITGLEEGLFPHEKLDHEEITREEQEEERRLFYVALTRARKKVLLSYAQTRTIFGSRTVNIPSEFISDIPEELLEESEDGNGEHRRPLLVIDF